MERVAPSTKRPCSKTSRSYLKRKAKTAESTGRIDFIPRIRPVSSGWPPVREGFSQKRHNSVRLGGHTALRELGAPAAPAAKLCRQLSDNSGRIEPDVRRSGDDHR